MPSLVVGRAIHALIAAGAAFFWAAIAIDIILYLSATPGATVSLPFMIANNPGAYGLPLASAVIIFLSTLTKPAVGDAVLLSKYGRR